MHEGLKRIEHTLYIYNEIFVQNVYSLTQDEVNGAGILDVGGNEGLFALFCSQFNPKQIISVEANQNNFINYLTNTKNINTRVICAAVSSLKNSIVTINDEGGCSRISLGSQYVATISLDKLVELLDPNPNLILKIDVEGSEYDILYNTDPEILKKFKLIVMEAHNFLLCDVFNPANGDRAKAIGDYIEKIGFDKSYTLPNENCWPVREFIEKYNMPPAYQYKFKNRLLS